MLTDTFIGNARMRHTKFEEVSNETEGFLTQDGEDDKDMYRHLKSLVKSFRKVGVEHANDAWVKRKYAKALMNVEPFDLKILTTKKFTFRHDPKICRKGHFPWLMNHSGQ